MRASSRVLARWWWVLLLVVAVPASAANFSSTIALNMSTRSAASYAFGPVVVPTGVAGVQISLDVRQATDPLPAVSATLEGSLDGGSTWMAAGGFSRASRVRGNNRAGAPLEELGFTVLGGTFWNDTTNVNRRLRGQATVGGSMRFSLTVQPL